MAAAATLTLPGPLGQPDIAYTPNLETYQARVKRRQESEDLPKALPDGFPQKLQSSLVWNGSTISQEYEWSYQLNQEELRELDNAVKQYKESGKPLGDINQDTFPLPNLHPVLRGISNEIHNGHGFKVVRGIPVHTYTREENIIAYAGLAAHVGPIRGRQDSRYKEKSADVVLAHIKDLTKDYDPHSIGAPAYTTEKQVFHTDAGDIIALFALESAEEGGESYLSSSWTVYNELAATRPDLVRTLAEPWAFDTFGTPGQPGYISRPLLHYQPATEQDPERLIIQYARRSFTGYWGLPRSSAIPPITEAQAEALDALHFLAEKHAVALHFRPGDVQFVNNLSIFHARGAFKDSEQKQRHLVRLWLRDEEHAWKTPTALQGLWDRLYKDVQPEAQRFPLEPSIDASAKGRKGYQ
jgi:hypothetical protein